MEGDVFHFKDKAHKNIEKIYFTKYKRHFMNFIYIISVALPQLT